MLAFTEAKQECLVHTSLWELYVLLCPGTLEEGTVPAGFRPGPGNKPLPKCAAWFAKLKGTDRIENVDPRVPVLGEGFFGRRRRRKKVPAEKSMEKATRRRYVAIIAIPS